MAYFGLYNFSFCKLTSPYNESSKLSTIHAFLKEKGMILGMKFSLRSNFCNSSPYSWIAKCKSKRMVENRPNLVSLSESDKENYKKSRALWVLPEMFVLNS